jgi:hypothetical protein
VNGDCVKALEVKKEDTGELRLWVEFARSASSDDMDLVDGWFVYPETETRIWVFNGDQGLKLFQYSGSPGNEIETQDPHSVSEIPQEILPRLPENLKQDRNVEQEPGADAK